MRTVCGGLGRLWQTLILARWKPSLEYLPIESHIHDSQSRYYEALGRSDAAGEATPFVEIMLPTMKQALAEAVDSQSGTDQVTDQVKQLLSVIASNDEFSREALMERLSLQHRPTFRTNYLRPTLDAGLVEMTQPDSPNSPTQRYWLTAQGRAVAKQLGKAR